MFQRSKAQQQRHHHGREEAEHHLTPPHPATSTWFASASGRQHPTPPPQPPAPVASTKKHCQNRVQFSPLDRPMASHRSHQLLRDASQNRLVESHDEKTLPISVKENSPIKQDIDSQTTVGYQRITLFDFLIRHISVSDSWETCSPWHQKIESHLC